MHTSTTDAVLDTAPPIPYWNTKRHLTCGNPTPAPSWSAKPTAWRPAPGKLKTSYAALVLCLNIDVDPPDVVKTNPCAHLECWVDPHSMPSHKALEAIGNNLKHQFECLSLKIPYKPILDPSYEDLRRFCQSLRRQAQDDAVLFHYNGHGVPKPTASGELWCFNRDYTQYIPVSLQEVQNWLGAPGVYIWDCSAAGHLLTNFNIFAQRRDQEMQLQPGVYGSKPPYASSLQLAACLAHEQLPSCPELPADLFTSCLTSPIDIALRFFLMNHQLPNNIKIDMVLQLPGDLKDRKTPLGELNWIFTAITDTIAWTTFDHDTFTRLYRCDLLIACLFRNFLLAERIMKNYSCTPHTSPALPPTNTHPLWATWDLAVDTCLRQLPSLLYITPEDPKAAAPSPPQSGTNKPYVYMPSRFFSDQLTAFEVWISPLDQKAEMQQLLNGQHHLVPRKPPDQLPIVLQVLLSQPHRLRALILLSQFVDLGPWAVNLVLTIGIFPYISKLLQAAGQDLRPVLIFIWARIMAVDPSVQNDLYASHGYKYFSNILSLRDEHALPNSSEHKAMCSFILSALSRDFVHGQNACRHERVFDNCFDALNDGDFLLRQWSALCIAQMWDANDEMKIYGVDHGAQDRLVGLLSDDSVEVRCAALYALGTFFGASGSANPQKRGGGGTGMMSQLDETVQFRMEIAVATGATLAIREDASPMCRKELLVMLSCLVKEWRGYFIICAWLYWEEDRKWRLGGSVDEDDLASQAVAEWLDECPDDDTREGQRVLLSSFFTIFVCLLDFSVDPYSEVSTHAQTIVDYIMALLLESPFSRVDSATLGSAPTRSFSPDRHHGHRSRLSSVQMSPTIAPGSPSIARPSLSRADTVTSTFSSTLKRTGSFANALKSLANGISFPSTEDLRLAPAALAPQPPKPDSDLTRPPSPNLNIASYSSPYPPPAVDTSDNFSNEPSDFYPSDVMQALIAEDMERLRARRRTPHQAHHYQQLYGQPDMMPSPSSSTFSMESGIILGLGTGKNVRETLPLKSVYYDFCCEYFKEPQMRVSEADEPGSIEYNYQVWRQQRNEIVNVETEHQAPIADSCRWDRSVATIQTASYPLTIAFHSYDQHVVIANDKDTISVWDWSKRRRLCYFCNGNPRGTNITALEIVNQDIGGIIVSGSADGVVRLYRNYDPALQQGPLQMVSSWRAINELIYTDHGAGLIMDWQQASGVLLVGGDSRTVKVWDAQTETSVSDLDTNSNAPLTSMTSDVAYPQTFVAGFADGAVKVFDRRLDDEQAIVRSYTEHNSWVQNVKWLPKGDRQPMSASLDGEVKLWDLRGSEMSVQTWDTQSTGISAFDIHPLTSVFATTSAVTPNNWRSQRVLVQNAMDSPDTSLSSFMLPTGLGTSPTRTFSTPYMPRWTSLAFHPKEMLYAIGAPDGNCTWSSYTSLRPSANFPSQCASWAAN
uniref:Raptor N-terminal CASPase-like domain-containing protein n=1 Tax=Schizophyllum commune (strain H4-8 / FGSC 9210) TaxID=578458 RepID=D8PM15_SCHCM